MRKLFLFTFIILLVTSCSEVFSDDNFLGGIPDNYVNLMERGWTAFEMGNFEAAIEFFQTAADRDATKPEPYLGLGWSYARSDALDLETAMKNLSKTQAFALFDPENEVMLLNESNAGKSIISYAAEDYTSAISFADEVLGTTPDFEMRHDAVVNAEFLNWTQINAYFNMDEISTVYGRLIEMDYTFQQAETVTETINVVVTDANLGVHEAQLALPGVAPGLIYVTEVTATIDGFPISYDVQAIDEGGNSFTVVGSPLIPPGTEVNVMYDFAQNYGSFIDELLEHLSNQ